MENKFNAIVLSDKEPNVEDLWMRLNKIGDNIYGHSLWWFTSQGWKKLFDFDTRYSMTSNYDESASQEVLSSEESYNSKSGIVAVDNTYYTYTASRELGDNSNIVLEKGLKYHVDDLQKKIDSLDKRITTNASNIRTLQNKAESLEEQVNEHTVSIEYLTRALDNATEILTSLSSRMDSIEDTLNAT